MTLDQIYEGLLDAIQNEAQYRDGLTQRALLAGDIVTVYRERGLAALRRLSDDDLKNRVEQMFKERADRTAKDRAAKQNIVTVAR